ncbi:MAG: hypothetical protein B9S32_03935 [Verrucomicrobia bacterium Tous-C9LFEB]|nr:MAG: hypothetical protein B9S32_03935 [Verrucomicrobia bacterium Tous-C9LFEB]
MTLHFESDRNAKPSGNRNGKIHAGSPWYAARSLSPYPGRFLIHSVLPGKVARPGMALRRLFRIALFVSLVLMASRLYADELAPSKATAGALSDIEIETKNDPKAIGKLPQSGVLEEASLQYSYAGKADLDSNPGALDEQVTAFRYGASIPVNPEVTILAGVQYTRLDFGQSEGSPLPNSLETVAISTGLHYKISNQWSVFGIVSPQLNLLNSWDEISSQDIRMGGAVGAVYEFNKDLSVQFGLALNPGQKDWLIIPLLGLNWRFAESWTLNLGLPKTSIDYQLSQKLRLSVIEMAFHGGTYRTGSTYGNSVGRPELNDRDLTYTEVRVGTGATYALTKNVDLGLSAGVVAYREFKFEDSGYKQKVEPAPYVQVGVKVGF